MSYIDKNLMNGENVLYRAKLHWMVFFWPVLWFVLFILSVSGEKQSNQPSSGDMFAPMLVLFFLITGASAIIRFLTSEFGLTNQRVIVKVGFIRRTSLEILLNKIEGIQVNQSILGRILGYGTIIIAGTGSSKSPFHKISSPLMFRSNVQEQLSKVTTNK